MGTYSLRKTLQGKIINALQTDLEFQYSSIATSRDKISDLVENFLELLQDECRLYTRNDAKTWGSHIKCIDIAYTQKGVCLVKTFGRLQRDTQHPLLFPNPDNGHVYVISKEKIDFVKEIIKIQESVISSVASTKCKLQTVIYFILDFVEDNFTLSVYDKTNLSSVEVGISNAWATSCGKEFKESLVK